MYQPQQFVAQQFGPQQFGPQRPTDGMAIAALICGACQIFWFLTGIPAIVLGHMARRQTRQTGDRGDGMGRDGTGWDGLAGGEAAGGGGVPRS